MDLPENYETNLLNIKLVGEIMGRIATPDNIRIRQSRLMDKPKVYHIFAGAEASVSCFYL